MSRMRIVGVVAAAGVLVAACGGPAASPTAATVSVTLQEWAISANVTSVPAGQVRFTVTNNGPADIHELVVMKTDIELLALPTDATGTVDESQGGMEVKGEVEDVAVGATEDLTLTLEPGKYVLICNIYSAEENEAHYSMGMRTVLTVNP